MSAPPATAHRGPVALLAALAAALLVNQYLTLPKLRDIVVAGAASVHIERAQAGALDLIRAHWHEHLGVADLAAAAALAAIVLAMVAAELRARWFSGLLAHLERRPAAMLALVAFLAALATRYYLNFGSVFMGDATMHVATSGTVAAHLRQGTAPLWSNAWYGGYPMLEFYAPLYFYVTGVLTALSGDVHLATKLVLWLAHVASVLSMYLFLRAALQRRAHALVGALGYGLAFHHMHIILYRGDLHMSLVYAIYPLPFLHLERYLNGRTTPRAAFLATAFTATALIIAHHAYAFFGLVFFGVYLLVRTRAAAAGAAAARTVALFGLALAGATLASAFLLVPVLIDQADVRGMPGLPFEILVPTLPRPGMLVAMLNWSVIGNRVNIGYLGLSIAALAVAGSVHAVRARRPAGMALLAAGLYALLTLRGGVQYNVKNMNFVVFYCAALAGFAPAALEAWWNRRRGAVPGEPGRARLALALCALIALDLGPSTFQDVYREGDEFKQSMYARIRARDPAYKTIERQLIQYEPGTDQRRSFDPHMLGTVMSDEPLATPFGWVHEAAGRVFGYNAEMAKQLHRELHADRISERSLQGLYLMGVKFLTFRDRSRYYSPPLPYSPDYTLDRGLLELRHASPLIAAPRLVTAGDVPGYDPSNVIETRRYFDDATFAYDNDGYDRLVAPLLDAMRIDRHTGIAAAIPVVDHPGARAGVGGALSLRVDAFSAGLERIRIRYTSGAPAFAQLAYAYFPYLDVRVDGRPVEFWRSAMGQLVMDLPAGAHEITVRGRASPVRRASFLFSLAAAAALLSIPAGALRRLAASPEIRS
ncbi:MAG: 6-pyruvoyl-tetrahydropterin synthase-related protein [Gammaproteobacteria bacterium]